MIYWRLKVPQSIPVEHLVVHCKIVSSDTTNVQSCCFFLCFYTLGALPKHSHKNENAWKFKIQAKIDTKPQCILYYFKHQGSTYYIVSSDLTKIERCILFCLYALRQHHSTNLRMEIYESSKFRQKMAQLDTITFVYQDSATSNGNYSKFWNINLAVFWRKLVDETCNKLPAKGILQIYKNAP